MDDTVDYERVPEWTRSAITTLVENMSSMYGYCHHCSRDVVSYAVKRRLLE